MRYVDGFVLPVPKKKLKEYRRIAKMAGKVWREHGALQYVECVGDDLKIKMGVPFPRLAKVKPGETVVISWIVYKSRGASQSRQRQGDEGSAHREDDGSEVDALRRQAHDHGRFQDPGRFVTHPR